MSDRIAHNKTGSRRRLEKGGRVVQGRISGMAVLVGIDEAGFGPILGPLVVSSSSFSLPFELLKADLWQVLRRSVLNRRKGLAGRLLIADSKKAYSRKKGLKGLERTVLAALECLGSRPAGLNELLTLLCPDSIERLKGYPWYEAAGGCGGVADKTDVAIASAALKKDMVSNDMKLLEIKSCCLDVAYYNKMVNNVKNKADVLFSTTSQLIKRACEKFGEDDLQIVIDRQGGRVYYRRCLQRSFADMELRILKESAAGSSYELKGSKRTMRLHFAVGADDKFLPVSLASMVSKYLREILVGNMNRYFTSLHTQLRPTAGYWKDGLRFIEDLKRYIPHIQYDSNQLIRCR